MHVAYHVVSPDKKSILHLYSREVFHRLKIKKKNISFILSIEGVVDI
jgi:hypothetical protein